MMDSSTGVSKKTNKKIKNAQTRVYDDDGFRRRVDCICFRDASMEEVLLVSSRNHEGCWTIPGGGLEPGESPSETALREIAEEAGVKCRVHTSVGVYEVSHHGDDHTTSHMMTAIPDQDPQHKTRTEVFIMTAEEELSHWLDNDQCSRERKWFEVQHAVDTLRSRPNYAKLEYFELACRTARKSSSVLPSIKPAVSLISDDGDDVDKHPQAGFNQPVHGCKTSSSRTDKSNVLTDIHPVPVHTDCIQKCLCV